MPSMPSGSVGGGESEMVNTLSIPRSMSIPLSSAARLPPRKRRGYTSWAPASAERDMGAMNEWLYQVI